MSDHSSPGEAFTVYDMNTGQVLRTGSCPYGHAEIQAIRPNEGVVLGTFLHDDYFHDGQKFVVKREMLLTREGAFLRGLPIPCVVRIEGDEYVCEDGDIELSFEYPGSYMLRFEAHGYKDCELTVQWPLSPMQEATSPS
jgi:hypothetical protein